MRQKSNPALDEVKYGVAQIRMYPTTAQKTYFWRLFGANRWLWNQIKDMTDKRYQNNKKLLFPSTASLKKLLPRLKQEYPWLKKANSTSLQATVEYYCNAQEAFFKQTPVGRKPPKFKGRHFYRQSATLKNVPSKRKDGSLLYPIQTVNKYCLRIGTRKPIFVETSSLNRLKHKVIKRMMVVYRADLDRFYLSFVVADQKEELPQYQAKTQKTGKMIGIDVGLGNEWLVTSDNHRWSVPQTFEAEKAKNLRQSHCDRNRTAVEKRVARFNQKHQETKIDKYDFANWQKLRKTKSKYQVKINNIRLDYIQQATTWLVKHYDVIAIEDLKTKNLLGNHKLAHNIANAGWSMFRRMLAYKCKWYGKKLIVVPPQYTSRICSDCGQKNPAFAHMKTRDWLSVREWTCPFCRAEHDRDVNAAKNILARAVC